MCEVPHLWVSGREILRYFALPVLDRCPPPCPKGLSGIQWGQCCEDLGKALPTAILSFISWLVPPAPVHPLNAPLTHTSSGKPRWLNTVTLIYNGLSSCCHPCEFPAKWDLSCVSCWFPRAVCPAVLVGGATVVVGVDSQ